LRIADFIAGMTDRYAMVEHARLFGATPELRWARCARRPGRFCRLTDRDLLCTAA
jgi:hypothetical protein